MIPSDVELDSFVLRFIQDSSRLEEVVVPVENQEEYLLLFGPIQRVRRLATAFVRLRKAGFGPEGLILLRSALEHAVTVQWFYLTVGGKERLKVALTKDQADFAKFMRDASTSAKAEWAEFELNLRARVPAGKAGPRFSGDGMVGDLDQDSFLATTYKIFSQVGHVTHQAVLDHVVEKESGYELRQAPEFDLSRETNYALASICLLASWVQARLERNSREIEFLEDSGHRLTMPWRLDQNLPLANRRFGAEIEAESR